MYLGRDASSRESAKEEDRRERRYFNLPDVAQAPRSISKWKEDRLVNQFYSTYASHLPQHLDIHIQCQTRAMRSAMTAFHFPLDRQIPR